MKQRGERNKSTEFSLRLLMQYGNGSLDKLQFLGWNGFPPGQTRKLSGLSDSNPKCVWRRSRISGAKVHAEFGPLIVVGPLAFCNAGTAGRGLMILGLVQLVVLRVVPECVRRETVDHGIPNGTSLYSRKRTRV
jgi:hypothetical protein